MSFFLPYYAVAGSAHDGGCWCVEDVECDDQGPGETLFDVLMVPFWFVSANRVSYAFSAE